MPTNDKKEILTGDTYKVAFEALQPVQEDENSFTFERTAIFPTDAYAQLWSVNDQEYVAIGEVADPLVDDATIASNVVSYMVLGDFTGVAGDYTLIVTAVFADGQTVSERRKFRVKDKQ